MHKSDLSLIAIIGLAAIFYFATMSALVFHIQLPLSASSSISDKTPTVNIVLYEGENSGSQYGFGYSPSTLSSPGPTLRFTTSDVVNITVINIGKMPHGFAITSAPRTGAEVLFNAEIGSKNNPLQPGQEGSVVFKPNLTGSAFSYICPISGHAEAGMYGSIIISTISGTGMGM
ncbi:MAG TPA: multicopper oxidase domain-containing protein [Candidatus Acidoferrum sp.]|nr:multicopper oxidase domain-containing protein [Candidatus Acidoferrum sp.]